MMVASRPCRNCILPLPLCRLPGAVEGSISTLCGGSLISRRRFNNGSHRGHDGFYPSNWTERKEQATSARCFAAMAEQFTAPAAGQSMTRANQSTVPPAGQATVVNGLTSAASSAAEDALVSEPRHDWTREEIRAIYESPLMDLIFNAAQVHRRAHRFREVQQCTLLSIKTGGCSEDCSYCPQSSRYATSVKAERMLEEDIVLEAARKAKEGGSTRFCMGAAWRDNVGRKTSFNKILGYVKEIR
ncbi:hypothetical protein CBR_g54828 [Chara braunii]|uniref:Radical SAM core domain-containing protein n=1 Tax=Chara braunii TaxID=69332 RepID=A0A388JPL0_CHABU|nr:hypothetical protein CBR_g54828 [Chara braunii]|eukprot:GBG59725.1 hypothetical protein CBR_g54828 [Chara braunii]